MTLQDAAELIIRRLTPVSGAEEAQAISRWLLEYFCLDRKTSPLLYPHRLLPPEAAVLLPDYLSRLEQHEPLQYVLGETWFCGLRFTTDKRALIPRPETEELVEWIISEQRFPLSERTVLDIGTGTGCIPITLKRRLPPFDVTGLDISKDALDLAGHNARQLGVDVHFLQANILDESQWHLLPAADILVSNPPYIPAAEIREMNVGVTGFEPHLALFVPDNDPLLFYRKIALLGNRILKSGGNIYLELHAEGAAPAIQLFREAGYQTLIRRDMQGKNRMLKAWKEKET